MGDKLGRLAALAREGSLCFCPGGPAALWVPGGGPGKGGPLHPLAGAALLGPPLAGPPLAGLPPGSRGGSGYGRAYAPLKGVALSLSRGPGGGRGPSEP